MSNTLTLDAARKQAQDKYEDFSVVTSDGTTVNLRSPMRLSKSRRNRVSDLQKSLETHGQSGDDDAALACIYSIFREVSDDSKAVETLIADLEEDELSTTMVIMEEYGKVAQVGEASHSPS